MANLTASYLVNMPVIVVGADTDPGREIATGLWSPPREIRVFVTDPSVGTDLKQRGFKVAVGDVSDDSHIEGAATLCFTAVLVTEAASDHRERSFASTAEAVTSGWARAVRSAGVKRVIWVSEGEPPKTEVNDVHHVDPSDPEMVEKVVALDDAQLAG